MGSMTALYRWIERRRRRGVSTRSSKRIISATSGFPHVVALMWATDAGTVGGLSAGCHGWSVRLVRAGSVRIFVGCCDVVSGDIQKCFR